MFPERLGSGSRATFSERLGSDIEFVEVGLRRGGLRATFSERLGSGLWFVEVALRRGGLSSGSWVGRKLS